MGKPAAPASPQPSAPPPSAPEKAPSIPIAVNPPEAPTLPAMNAEYEGAIGLELITAKLANVNGGLEGSYSDLKHTKAIGLRGAVKEETGSAGLFEELTIHRCLLQASAAEPAGKGDFAGSCAYTGAPDVTMPAVVYGTLRDAGVERPFWLRAIDPQDRETHAKFRGPVLAHTATPRARCGPSLRFVETTKLSGEASLVTHWTGDPCAVDPKTPSKNGDRVAPPVWSHTPWLTVVDKNGAWVNSFSLGEASPVYEELMLDPVDLKSEVTVMAVERIYLAGAHMNHRGRAWLFMQGPDGRTALPMALPDHFYEGPSGCMHTRAVQIYAVDLDDAPPRELVVVTKETKKLKCTDEPEPRVSYRAYRLNARAMRFDASPAATKVVKAAVEAAGPAWERM